MKIVSRFLVSGLGALLSSLVLLSFLYKCCFEESIDLLFTILLIWVTIYSSIWLYEMVIRDPVDGEDSTLQNIGLILVCAVIIFVCFMR